MYISQTLSSYDQPKQVERTKRAQLMSDAAAAAADVDNAKNLCAVRRWVRRRRCAID